MATKTTSAAGRHTKKAATKKAATKKAAKKTAATKKAAIKKPTSKRATTDKAVKKTATKKAAKKASAASSSGGRKVGIRVRMYRVGFGDFFLLTVPGNDGPAHILIDCGVHAANIGSMDACVQDLKKVTGGKLALVIVTHYHADHLSGFASNYDDFAKFAHVGAVWITNRLDPKDERTAAFNAKLDSVARQLEIGLAARGDDRASNEARAKVENALGAAGGGNAKALKLLQGGFECKPKVFYYQGGDTPFLPPELEGAIEAQILAPSPKDSGGEFSASDNKTEQYLAAAADANDSDRQPWSPFEKDWPASASDYPAVAFQDYAIGREEPWKHMESVLGALQPDALAATADKLDGTLNNQSLVVLFTVKKKKLLFVGDAQWGNWAYWLYGRKVTGKDPGISEEAKEILGSIDFYKVGHHGSTNATPIPAVAAMNHSCAAMCSTAVGAYGNPAKKTEVPRTALLDALSTQLGDRMVRSDWVAANGEAPDDSARDLPSGFSTPGELYIDFEL
ncbi:MAG: hypothetical protein JNK05_35880 [Myxococcales bacterium]|nr:hypothetical protein [Myxococcales bacterium]